MEPTLRRASKIVLADRADYEWARAAARTRPGTDLPGAVWPVADTLAPTDLAQWILEDRLPVRMQVQLHKLIWGNARGR